jgi:tetrahydromethanopterin S-methyltransferase subunit C
MSAAAVLAAVAFLFAALGRAETRRRRLLLAASLGTLALAVVGALMIGIVS